MNDLELLFTMLGERVTAELAQQEKPDTFEKIKKVASRGGSVAGKARKDTEKELGRPISSSENYLPEKRKIKTIKSRKDQMRMNLYPKLGTNCGYILGTIRVQIPQV